MTSVEQKTYKKKILRSKYSSVNYEGDWRASIYEYRDNDFHNKLSNATTYNHVCSCSVSETNKDMFLKYDTNVFNELLSYLDMHIPSRECQFGQLWSGIIIIIVSSASILRL